MAHVKDEAQDKYVEVDVATFFNEFLRNANDLDLRLVSMLKQDLQHDLRFTGPKSVTAETQMYAPLVSVLYILRYISRLPNFD